MSQLDPTQQHSTLHVYASQIVRALGWIIAALAALSLLGSFSTHALGHGRLLGFVPEFNLNTENNVPTYFSSFLLLASSALLAVIAHVQTPSSHYRRHWIGLAVIFLFLSIDEMASFHERLVEPMRGLLDAGGWLYYAWVIPGIAFVLLFGLVYLRFWFDLPSRPRRLFSLAGLTYVAGAIGLELVGGWYVDLYERNFTYELITTVEETLEMAGIAIFAYALLVYVGYRLSSVTFRVVPK